MRRSKFATALAGVFEDSDRGWVPDPQMLDGGIADWKHKFPNLKPVADGRPCRNHAKNHHTDRNDPVCRACDECFKKEGRGGTSFDFMRRVEKHGIVRFDYHSQKTVSQEKGGKIPSKFSLTTGNQATIDALIEGIELGASYPTIFVVKGKNGGAYWIAADLAPVIREYGVVGIEDYPEGGHTKGNAPPIYVKWSSVRNSGAARLRKMRELGLPVDERVHIINNVMCGPGWFKYPELTISLSSLGVRRTSWSYVETLDLLPALLDSPTGFGDDWDDMS